MFWRTFTDYLIACYIAGIHAFAFLGGMTVYWYYWAPAELCKQVVKHLLLPFGLK